MSQFFPKIGRKLSSRGHCPVRRGFRRVTVPHSTSKSLRKRVNLRPHIFYYTGKQLAVHGNR
jgi:hypothetical protein